MPSSLVQTTPDLNYNTENNTMEYNNLYTYYGCNRF